MLTCKSMSTYITQYPLIIEILKYADLHHPWGAIKIIHLSMLTCKSMSSYITQHLLVI